MTPSAATMLDTVIDLSDRRVDLGRGVVEGERGTWTLTGRERSLLAYLVTRPGQAVERAELEREVFGLSPAVLSRSLDVTVARLRPKLELDPRRPVHLQTIHGTGYRWWSEVGPRRVAPPAFSSHKSALRLGTRLVDLERGIVIHAGGEAHLTGAERALLERLAEAGDVVAADQLSAKRLSRPVACERVAKAVHRLRRKIEEDPSRPRYLIGVRGAGYRLRLPPEELTLSEEIKRLVWATVRHLGQALGLSDCVLYLRQDDDLRQVAAFGPKLGRDEEIVNPLVLPLGQGIVGAASRLSATQRVDDITDDSRYIPDALPARSELAVPIRVRGEVVGVIDSEDPRPRAYGSEHVRSFETLAEVVAAGLGVLRTS